MTAQLYTYRATVLKVEDADNIVVRADLGFDFTLKISVRLDGINAREDEEPGGPEALAHLVSLCPVGTVLTLRSVKRDKFAGRCRGRLVLDDGTDIAKQMVADIYAVPWNGRGPRPVPPWPRPV